MKLHADAPLSRKGRALIGARIVEQGWTAREAAQEAGVSECAGDKWLARWRAERPQGLVDRPSVPKYVANRTAEL